MKEENYYSPQFCTSPENAKLIPASKQVETVSTKTTENLYKNNCVLEAHRQGFKSRNPSRNRYPWYGNILANIS